MKQWIQQHGTDDTEALLDYAYSLSQHYGEAIGSLSCQMYDEIAELSGVYVKSAEMANTATYSEVAKAVNGAKKTSDNIIPNAVYRLVKMVGADTTLKNAQRDGAQFAWIPHGNTCAFCLMLASRGWQYMSKDALKGGHAEHIHANCDCQYAVRFDKNSDIEGYDLEEYQETWNDAEGVTVKQKLNSIRRMFASTKKTFTLPRQLGFSVYGEMNFIPTGTEINNVTVIAGKGCDTELRVAPKLSEKYGGNYQEWSKKVGLVKSEKYDIDVHWYDLNDIMYEEKIKNIKVK